MFSHAIILAALSAGALAGGNHGWTPTNHPAVLATAFAPSDTACTGKRAGHNVSLAINLVEGPSQDLTSSCIIYAPKHGQNVKLDYPSDAWFFLTVYSDPECKNQTGQVSGWAGQPQCLPMQGGNAGAFEDEGTADWESVQLQLL